MWPPPADNYRAHSEAMYDMHWRIQIAAYIDDLPPRGSGLTLWPCSHQRIWDYWEAVHRDLPPSQWRPVARLVCRGALHRRGKVGAASQLHRVP